jgi:hypothetical protein
MTIRRMTDNEIRIRIVPTHLRWPEPSTGLVWNQMRKCVDLLHGLVRKVDNNCAEVEQKTDISAEEIARRRTARGRQALNELANFKPFRIAEQAAIKDIEFLKNLDTRTPHQAQMYQRMTKALDELRYGIGATERALRERCDMR